ncbi:MAG: site-specific integrase [Ignavibacteria bacterium]|nr:site-specific integrase [Ignavibacteria bacterium]
MVKLRKKNTSNKRQSLYLDIYYNGKRSYEFLKIYLTKDRVHNKDVMNLAESIRAKRELEINTQEHGFIPTYKKKIRFVDYYETVALKKDQKKGSTYISTLAHLKRWKKGDIPIAAINEHWIEDFEKYLKDIVCENSILTYFNSLKAVLNIAVKEKFIGVNPFTYYRKMRKPDVERVYLTINELRKLASTESDRPEIKRAFLFACNTGLRLSDVQNLKWENIRGDKLDYRQQKTQGFEYLPLSSTAQKLIYKDGRKILKMPNEKVFELPSQQTITLALKRWSKIAGITKKITFHTARHTFATVALTRGVDLYTVSKLLGHTDIKNTQIYARVVDDKKQAAIL